MISDECRSITAISPVYTGASHDFGIFKEENISELLPTKTPIYLDTGFEGVGKLGDELNIRKPKKKPRGRRLNGGEKLGNRLISKERVKVEHAIGGLKRMKIASNIFRGISKSMNETIELACGIWNYIAKKRFRNLSGQGV